VLLFLRLDSGCQKHSTHSTGRCAACGSCTFLSSSSMHTYTSQKALTDKLSPSGYLPAATVDMDTTAVVGELGCCGGPQVNLDPVVSKTLLNRLKWTKEVFELCFVKDLRRVLVSLKHHHLGRILLSKKQKKRKLRRHVINSVHRVQTLHHHL